LKGALPRLVSYCWRYDRLVWVGLGGAILTAVSAAAIPLVQRQVIDDVVVVHRESIWPLACLLLTAAVGNFVGIYTRRYASGKLSVDVQHDLRIDLFDSLSHLDGRAQDNLRAGQLIGRSISDLNLVQGLVVVVPGVIANGAFFVLSLCIMVVISPLLTLIAAVVIPLLGLVVVASRRQLFPASWDVSQASAAIASIVDENISGVRVVKGFGQEEQEQRRLEAASSRLFGSRLRMIRLTARYVPALSAIPSLGLVGVVALGGWLAIRGDITLGTFLAFSAYLAQMIGPVRALTGIITMAQETRASVVRVFDVIDARPTIDDGPAAVDLPADESSISFQGVQFSYVPSVPVLRDLTFEVGSGETVAIVGASGAGKSTIAELLLRFYVPDTGTVSVGGMDTRCVTFRSLRAAIGLVMEDSFLFSGTVRDNIAYGRPEATQEEVVAAAMAAHAHEFISRLPQAYETAVGERGLTLSGGQRQRIALARALATDPRVLVLDNATSAIDPQLEESIYRALRTVTRARTTLIISHRKSALSLADRIVVLDEGRVIDIGTHEELVDRCSTYRTLVSGAVEEGIEARINTVAAARASARFRPDADGALSTSTGPGGRRVGGVRVAGGDFPPSPQLLAQVAALPPVKDRPRVDVAAARLADRQFTLLRLLRPLTFALVVALALDALDALAGLSLPALVRNGIDHGIQVKDFNGVLLVALIGLAIVLCDWVVNIAATMIVGFNGERLLFTLRVKLSAQLQRLGLDFYEREMSGRILTRTTTDVDALSSFLQTGVITMVNGVLTFCGVLVALLVINLRLGLAVLCILPFLIVATLIFRAKSATAYADSREKAAAINACFAENVSGLRVVQAFGREQVNRALFEALSCSFRQSRLRAQRYMALYFPFVQTLSTVACVIVLVIAVGGIGTAGRPHYLITPGALIAYLLYIDMFFAPVQELSQTFDSYQQARVGLNRIGDLLSLRTSTPQSACPVQAGSLQGRIDLRDVDFNYSGVSGDHSGGNGSTAPNALSGIRLTVQPGETVALVGPTGAGKSTLVKLIARFYDATAGSILIDGVDVRDYDLVSYRRQLGVVPQECQLFAGTVRDAIAYARPGTDDADVEAAARAVGAHETIMRLPGGYHYEVAERGRNLSAGQRQMIALARAQLADPVILLLDEATAALDPGAEAAVNKAMAELTAARTTLVVAHRLTTAARADRIVVLDEGRVAESGMHEELLAAAGIYAALWDAFSRDLQME
jgi:ATP-binding cassette subfamily B protein